VIVLTNYPARAHIGVKAHMTVILRKLGASNHTQALMLAGRLAQPDDVTVSPEGAE
jgi:hypothetical protein